MGGDMVLSRPSMLKVMRFVGGLFCEKGVGDL